VAAFKLFARENGLAAVSDAEMLSIANRVATGKVTGAKKIAYLLIKP
jgi:hypothetical protein